MQITRSFKDTDRYEYDCGICNSSNGFAQVDTSQDASYFGTWANPFTFSIFCYCEGDTTLQQAESAEEFIAAIKDLYDWNINAGYGFGIDPGWPGSESCESIKAEFEKLGLGNLLH